MLYHFHTEIFNKILMSSISVNFPSFINICCLILICLYMYTCINLLIYIELHLTTLQPRKNTVKTKGYSKIFRFNRALNSIIIKPT